MTTNDREIVSALRRALADRIGRERYDLWFESAVRFQLADRVLRVLSPDPFTRERLRKGFREDLQQVAAALLGESTDIQFAVDRTLSRRSAQGEAGRPARSAARSVSDSASDGNRRPAPRAGAPPLGRRPLASLNDFVVGEGNRLAYTAAAMAAARPGAATPLFLYGPTGVGKTHLLEGVCRDARRERRMQRVVLLSAEQFTSNFLEALRGSGLPNFRRKHRDLQLLLIDDVHFFVGKKATLVELQHTIDTLLRAGRQLVLAADRPPSDLTELGGELIARFCGGLICGLERPDRETRLGIVRRMAAALGEPIPEEALEFIADRLPGDARRLAGALHRLDATRQALGRPITLELARTALADLIRTTQRAVELRDIDRAVCHALGLSPRTLQSDRKTKAVSHPRMLAMYLARKHTRAAFSEIGRYFGDRSHSTVISAEKKVDRWVRENSAIQTCRGACDIGAAIRRIEAQLRAG